MEKGQRHREKRSVSELNDRERRAKRRNWRAAQVKAEQPKQQVQAIIDQCMTPPLSPEPGVEPAPGPSRLGLE